MKNPSISVLLPVRNAADTIGPALESLFAQTFEDFEVVAVDDGSDDGRTLHTLEAFAGRDSRLRLVRLEHAGIVQALNRGLDLSRARFVARMDADDMCHPDRLRLQAGFLERNPDVDVVGCLVRFGGDRARCPGYAGHVDWLNGLRTHEEMALGVFRDAPLAHPSVMVRRQAFERFGAYRQGPFPEDYDLWLRWLEGGARLAKLPLELLTWNDPPGRLSRSDSRYDAEAFHRLKAGSLARWLAANNPFHPDVYVVGAGRVSRRRAEYLCAHGVRVKAYLDVDPRKVGTLRGGRPVLRHDQCPGPEACFVVSYVSNPDAWRRIDALLRGQGFLPGRGFVLAA
ncbi:glycosyltransferase family A protein [Fundidesulfovibrio butyratiphilus]